MKDVVYLILNRRGAAALRKCVPSLASGEIAIRLAISVPNAAFDKFIPRVAIDVPETAVIHPDLEITVEALPEVIEPVASGDTE